MKAQVRKSSYKLVIIMLLAFSLSSCELLQKQFGVYSPKDIPLGEYIGTAKILNAEDDKEAEAKEVKITFLPKEAGFQDAVGILVFENSSDRFLWRSDGNNHNIWNIMFSKDNTIYSNLHNSFQFNGVIKASDMKNTLEGKLVRTFENQDGDSVYYFKASQVFKPELETPEEAIVIKAGDEVTINVTKIDPDKVKILMLDLVAEGEAQEMPLSNSSSEKGVYSLSFATEKKQKKGKYKVFIEREDGEKSKSITIEIK